MFGTLGFSELIIILVIVLIIFGAGRLPQLGEGLGKALKGFKKEVREVDALPDPNTASATTAASSQTEQAAAPAPQPAAGAASPIIPAAPYAPGPELTPGTTASLMAGAAPQAYQPRTPRTAPSTQAPGQVPPETPAAPAASSVPLPPTMEQRMAHTPVAQRAAYPAVPSMAQAKPAAKRPSAIVNKDAVARVQAQQAAMREKAAQAGGLTPQDMQSMGESLGDALRTFRQAAAEVRQSIEPEIRTIRAEVDTAQKEIEQSIEAAKQLPATHTQEEPPKQG